MSNRACMRAPAVAAKLVALAPLPDDDREDEADDECSHCLGDGMDPWNDWLLPCPLCQGEQRP